MKDKLSMVAFFSAISQGNVPLVTQMISENSALATWKYTYEYWSEGEGTALQLAAEQGNIEIIQLLIDHGADVNDEATLTGWSPLHLAIRAQKGSEILLAHGAEIDIHAASGLGDAAKLRTLLSANPALAGEKGPDGATPLHFAATAEVAALLLDHGADIDARDDDHRLTALSWCADNQPVIDLLIARGALVDTIFVAAAIGGTEFIRDLLDANPQLVRAMTAADDYYGPNATPLHVAVWHDRPEVVDLLLERGADRNAIGGWFKVTPLHWAAERNSVTSARRLLAGKAAPGIQDTQNRTPLDWAHHFQRQAMISLLGGAV